jgi:formate-dependent nitrite reductase membrane component NrfD
MHFILELTIATLFGGMMTFQLLFAPLIFIKLENATARSFIRGFFPFYYLYFAILSGIATGLSFLDELMLPAALLAACFVGFLTSRQILMPLANKATDQGLKKQFDFYHRLTVLINTAQLIAIGYVLYIR